MVTTEATIENCETLGLECINPYCLLTDEKTGSEWFAQGHTIS